MDANRPAARRLPAGAECVDGGVHLRVWAPDCGRVEVVVEGGGAAELTGEADGWFSGWLPDAGAGARYRLRLDGGDSYPDPASRFQPEGPHGPSQVVDPRRFAWSDGAWRGLRREDLVLYEMHVGTFTAEGTWAAAQAQLSRLRELGITAIEVMPVNEFPGEFGWGYDGVDLFAPSHLYGEPDDLRRFVDAAHGLGIGVILDVVYNHFGPDGNYLSRFGRAWLGAQPSEWGDAPNFDGPGCAAVRAHVEANAAYWIDEFHLDGLRLDATQQIFDRSEEHIIGRIAQRARDAAAPRSVVVIGESEPQDSALLRPRAAGGQGCDALWNDDFHHSASVALHGRREAYYTDYRGRATEFVAAARHGFLYQGQRYAWQRQRRGTPALDLRPDQFIHFLENHDQVANTLHGTRQHLRGAPGRWRALTALLLLGPQAPMLFQGQEYGSSRPFTYFADHRQELAAAVRKGRLKFLEQFPSLQEEVAGYCRPDDPAAFAACKLDPAEASRPPHAELLALHTDLLALRRRDLAGRDRARVDAAVLDTEAFLLRYFGDDGDDRLLLVNLGPDLELVPAPEPLLAPPAQRRWRLDWSSEHPRYGGGGVPRVADGRRGWVLLGNGAQWLVPQDKSNDLHG